MSLKDIIDENIIPLWYYGIPKRKSTFIDLRKNHFSDLFPPVFFLSTGRSGTKWFAELLNRGKNTLVFHVPKPDLSVQNVFAYNCLQKEQLQADQDLWHAIAEIFLAAREQNLRYSYKTRKRYIETNNFLTFFAPVLAELFPESKFVHLYRHPGEFVRSAMDRNYYGEEDPWKMRRIKPVSGEYLNKWGHLSQLEKSAWLWNETNLFIEHFKSKINPDRIFSFNFNELTIESVKSLAQFIGVDFKENVIRKNMHKKKNIQKTRKFPPYSQWKEQDKQKLMDICDELAVRYGYNLK